MKDRPSRSKKLQIRMEPTGYQFLEDMAREAGLDTSTLAREIIYKEITSIMSQATEVVDGKVKRGATRRNAKKIGAKKYHKKG